MRSMVSFLKIKGVTARTAASHDDEFLLNRVVMIMMMMILNRVALIKGSKLLNSHCLFFLLYSIAVLAKF